MNIPDSLSMMYFPLAVALGALHALEPGHAKTLTAAYLIGIKGTKRDAVVLGLSVAATHSLVVVAIAMTALFLGREAFTDQATHWLQIASGVIVILLGSWLLAKRWRVMRRVEALRREHAHHEHEHHHEHGHCDHHDHDHDLMTDEEHARAHAADLPDYIGTGEHPSTRQIVAFGAAGGLIPCPASVTVMLLALSVGEFARGAFLLAGFSLGLAVALVGVGLLVVIGLTKIASGGRFSSLTAKAPIISAALVMLSGIAALAFVH